LIILQKVRYLPLQVIFIRRNNIAMEVVMFDLIHLYKGNMALSILTNVLLKQQVRLLYRDYLVRQRMHHQEPTPHVGNVINIGKVVLLKPKVLAVVLMEHAREGTDGTL
jgi:hypothetical protein